MTASRPFLLPARSGQDQRGAACFRRACGGRFRAPSGEGTWRRPGFETERPRCGQDRGSLTNPARDGALFAGRVVAVAVVLARDAGVEVLGADRGIERFALVREDLEELAFPAAQIRSLASGHSVRVAPPRTNSTSSRILCSLSPLSIQHCHTTPTRHPSLKSSPMLSRSLATFRLNFSAQNATFDRGIVAFLQPPWRCQKHPFISSTARHLGKQTSGLPGRLLTWSR